MMQSVKQLGLRNEREHILLTTIRSDPFDCIGHSVCLIISPRDIPDRKYSIRNAFASDQLALAE